MGKIVKYCNSCEEGFAEKFGFCPNCGEQLQAFEMVSPIGNTYIPQNQQLAEEPKNLVKEVKTDEIPVFDFEAKEGLNEAAPINSISAPFVFEGTSNAEANTESFAAQSFDAQEIEVEKPQFEEAEPFVPAPATDNFNNAEYYSTTANKDYSKNDGFYVTVIEEKNASQRNLLFLGSLLLMTFLVLGGTVVSLFNKDVFVGSIDQGDLIALVPEIEPVQIDEVPPPKQEKEKGGGGGGGGRDEETPVQKGRPADQTRERILIAPDKSITQVTNPAIPIIAQTQGDIKRKPTNEPYGLPNGGALGSNGMGTGGGMGGGRGNGMGNGIGTGEGIGNGSGSGAGDGNGNGNGTGPGGRVTPPPPPPTAPKKPAVTTAMRITYKPKALYTDPARQNNVQGNVTLKVTFLANGQIGSIAPVSGLPYGLTEQAIAAARNIKFEPQMVDGVPKAVTKTLQFSFTIY
jgi:TonB family protein